MNDAVDAYREPKILETCALAPPLDSLSRHGTSSFSCVRPTSSFIFFPISSLRLIVAQKQRTPSEEDGEKKEKKVNDSGSVHEGIAIGGPSLKLTIG